MWIMSSVVMGSLLFRFQCLEDPPHDSTSTTGYINHSDEISQASDPLYRASELGNATRVKEMLTFMPNNKNEEDRS